VIKGFKECPNCHRFYYITDYNFIRCEGCGYKLVNSKEKTLRELLNNGHSREVRYLLQKFLGRIPLCPTIIKDDKYSCNYLKEPLPERKFRTNCILCQEEMFKRVYEW